MNPILRKASPEDAQAAGTIVYDAFKTIAEHHGFSPDFPGREAAIDLVDHMIVQGDGAVREPRFCDARATVAVPRKGARLRSEDCRVRLRAEAGLTAANASRACDRGLHGGRTSDSKRGERVGVLSDYTTGIGLFGDSIRETTKS